MGEVCLMYTVFILVLVLLLIWQRKKIHWPGMFAGIVLAVLLLGTPLGGPLNDMVHALASGFTQLGNDLMSMVKGGGK
jgi:nucleoside permease NupC